MNDVKLERHMLAKRLLRRCRFFLGVQEGTMIGNKFFHDIDLFFASEPPAAQSDGPQPCQYCGFVASRLSDEDCPANPANMNADQWAERAADDILRTFRYVLDGKRTGYRDSEERDGFKQVILREFRRFQPDDQKRELVTQVMRLPDPPAEMGDGPQERVTYTLERLASALDDVSLLTKALQDAIDNKACWDLSAQAMVQPVNRMMDRLRRASVSPEEAQVAFYKALDMENRLKEYEASFKLYDDAMRRGTKLWQAAHPESAHVWPDAAKLAAWMMERMAILESFARRVALHMFDSNDLDYCEFIDVGMETGLLRKEAYDPAKHGDSEGEFEPGDDYYVLTIPSQEET